MSSHVVNTPLFACDNDSSVTTDKSQSKEDGVKQSLKVHRSELEAKLDFTEIRNEYLVDQLMRSEMEQVHLRARLEMSTKIQQDLSEVCMKALDEKERLERELVDLRRQMEYVQHQMNDINPLLQAVAKKCSEWKRKRPESDFTIESENARLAEEVGKKRTRQDKASQAFEDVDQTASEKPKVVKRISDPPSSKAIEMLDEAGFNVYYNEELYHDTEYAEKARKLVSATFENIQEVQRKVSEVHKNKVSQLKDDQMQELADCRANYKWINEEFLPYIKSNYANFVVTDEEEKDTDDMEEMEHLLVDSFYNLFGSF